MIPMLMGVEYKLNRLVGDFGDLFLERFRRLRIDRIGEDHALFGDNEKRTPTAVGERVEVFTNFRRFRWTRSERGRESILSNCLSAQP